VAASARHWGEPIVKLTIVAGTLAAVALAGPAAAQQQGDPAAGHELANKFCSSCHIVGTERVGSDVAPPFRVIAADPNKTFTERTTWRPPMHPVISHLSLTAQQIADINAYLDSLRPGAEPAGTSPDSGGAAEKLPPAPPEKLGEPIEPRPAPE